MENMIFITPTYTSFKDQSSMKSDIDSGKVMTGNEMLHFDTKLQEMEQNWC